MARFCFNRLDFRKVVLLLCVAGALLADDQEVEDPSWARTQGPWFTGPLITPSGHTILPGQINLQPYLNLLTDVGDYNSSWRTSRRDNFYTVQLRVIAKAGITNFMEVAVVPQALYRETQGEHACNIGDMTVSVNFQLLRGHRNDPWPSIKLALRCDAPFGKYQHLNPARYRTDAMGSGSWNPGPSILFSKIVHIAKLHYLEIRGSFEYRFSTPVHVKGYNWYGGDRTTRGTVYAGNFTNLTLACQYSLTQRWALACDAVYFHHNRSRFSGRTSKQMTRPSSEVVSLAPAIEYNFHRGLGMIGGVWFSVIGRNAAKFMNGMISLNAYF